MTDSGHLDTFAVPRKRNLMDWIRGGAYSREPSKHNEMLYRRERTPLLRWRLCAVAGFVWLIAGAPIHLLFVGLATWPEEWWSAMKETWQILRTGKLHG